MIGAGKRPARWWRSHRVLTIGLVVVLVVVGGTVLAGQLYVSSVHLPTEPRLTESTTLYYSDGVTVLARLGQEYRTALPYSALADDAVHAAVALDDPDFWTESEGAIGRAVLSQVYGLNGPPSSIRLRVLAWKLDNAYSKEEILAVYLNGVSFGRGTFGIEAAAQEYFGKSANREASAEKRLTTAETILLITLLRQPEPSPADPIGSPGYDPVVSGRSAQNSQERWREIRAAMVDRGYLARREADALAYPATVRPYVPRPTFNSDLPSGQVVKHVLSELSTLPRFAGRRWADIANGGYQVTTTVDARLQPLLEGLADGTNRRSLLFGQPANLQAASVVVEPGTGRVLAYYGGHDGNGPDYAGVYLDENQTAVGYGAHPPGSAFQAELLAAALRAGIALKSRWNGQSGQDMPGRTGANAIRNASTCPNATPTCTLADAVMVSLNSTAYAVTLSVGPIQVLEMARDAGIDHIWDDQRSRHTIAGTTDLKTLIPSRFDVVLGLGQYAVTVLDQANVMATFAASGLRAQAHFVRSVRTGANEIFVERLPGADAQRVLNPQAAADLTYALSRVAAAQLPGIASAGKTGTWEYNGRTDQNAHAWMTGYTPSLAMAVWIGNQREEQPLREKSGATIWGSGLPASIYRAFMTAATAELSPPTQPASFPPPAFIGNEHPQGSVG